MNARLSFRRRLCLASALILVGILRGSAQEEGSSKKGSGAPGSSNESGVKPLPKLADKDLPRATRDKPDPARDQYLKVPVFVSVDEQVKPAKGEPQAPQVRVLENHLKEYLRRAGHPVVDAPAGAVYRIEGRLEAGFVSTLEVLGRVAAWKYKGSVSLRVARSAGDELERIEIPDVTEDNVKSEDSAFLNLRRRLAKLVWDQMSKNGKVFTDADAVRLLGSLTLDPGIEEAETADDVTRRLAALGFRAVPYLLDALTDHREVHLESTYAGPAPPGGGPPERPGRPRVYHIADKALEEIFQKVSRMSLAIQPQGEGVRHLFAITLGWQNEWRRFCKPYKDSPNAPAAKSGEPAGDPGAPPGPGESSR